jgi:hypothetical protein
MPRGGRCGFAEETFARSCHYPVLDCDVGAAGRTRLAYGIVQNPLFTTKICQFIHQSWASGRWLREAGAAAHHAQEVALGRERTSGSGASRRRRLRTGRHSCGRGTPRCRRRCAETLGERRVHSLGVALRQVGTASQFVTLVAIRFLLTRSGTSLVYSPQVDLPARPCEPVVLQEAKQRFVERRGLFSGGEVPPLRNYNESRPRDTAAGRVSSNSETRSR